MLTCLLLQKIGSSNYGASAYSFVPHTSAVTGVGQQAGARFRWQRSSSLLENGDNATGRYSCRNGDSMTMKKRLTRQQQIPVGSDGEMPQNLKRKVVAKRNLRGDVIPKKARQKGGTLPPKLRPQGQSRQVSSSNNPSNLKILGGSARGRHLSSPDVFLRPMMGKVREAVYSTFTSFGLYDEGVYTRHLDIFSGSGSVGLESLSRGAGECTFVDLSRNCCDTIETNVVKCDFGEGEGGNGSKTRVICADALEVLRNPVSVGIPSTQVYDIITLCPPYEEITYADLLHSVSNSPLLTEDTIVLVEYPTELGCLPHVLSRDDGGKLIGVRNRRYGRTVIAMYIVNPTGRLEMANSRPEEFISL